jgi:formate-nitrite transporter family protein
VSFEEPRGASRVAPLLRFFFPLARSETGSTNGVSNSDQSRGTATKSDEEPKPLGQHAPEIIADAAKIGATRLHRSVPGDAITAFIGGMSVSFGAVAMAWAAASFGGGGKPSAGHVAGALAFPVGFIILLVGKSELFTENFFLPVTAVLERRGSARQLGALWGVSLAANLAGAVCFAFLISRPGVLDPAPAQELVDVAAHKVATPFWSAFVLAIFAGWLMTMLTWLLVAAEGFGPRLFIIWVMGALIILGQFNHVVISAAESFIALFLGAPFGARDWLTKNFLPALLGNLVGGVIFVTLLHRVQARYQEASPGTAES